jgi:hypothetical protein
LVVNALKGQGSLGEESASSNLQDGHEERAAIREVAERHAGCA